MPRKTRLALISERPATDVEMARMASQALDEAETIEHDIAPPEDILATLRGQLAETARIANTAVSQANEQRLRADRAEAEIGHAKANAAQTQEAAEQAVTRAKHDATAAIAAVQQQAKISEKAAAAANLFQQATGMLGALLSFLVDRAPVLLTLIGAFVLARDILAAPTTYQLAGLGIYGTVAVLPAVWLAIRKA